jgi:membrane fusion protein (multidrug efflux system)
MELDPSKPKQEPAEQPGGGNGQAAQPAPPPPRGRSADEDQDKTKRPFYRRPSTLIVVSLIIVGTIIGVIYWLHARQFEETDDAFIEGTTLAISAKVPGTIQHVMVVDNQDVAAGQVLVQIDPRDVQARVDSAQAALDAAKSKLDAAKTNVDLTRANTGAALAQANAGVEQAKAGVTSAEAQLASAQADVTAAQAEAQRRQADIKRYQSLDPRGVSQQQLDLAQAASESANANLLAAQKRVAGAKSAIVEAQAKVTAAQAMQQAAQTGPQQVASAEAQAKTAAAAVEQAAAELRTAQLDLSYTTIKAPSTGRITRKSIEVGDNVQVGANLMSLVQPEVWVIGNFKETQITHMQAGQEVDVYVDAYPGRVFHGKVQSIQAGTGARFSLLPPENATGNYVKVVQRVPVKITFDQDPQARRLLALGMSVTPRVHIAWNNNSIAPLPIEPPTTQPAQAVKQ